jgi:hypothetical protein
VVGVVVSNGADHEDSPYTTNVRHSSARDAPRSDHVHGYTLFTAFSHVWGKGGSEQFWGSVSSVTTVRAYSGCHLSSSPFDVVVQIDRRKRIEARIGEIDDSTGHNQHLSASLISYLSLN